MLYISTPIRVEVLLAINVCDGVATKPDLILYIDSTAQEGKKYSYIIKPVSCDGVINHNDPLVINL